MVAAEVVENAGQESGSRDGAGHHDDIEMGCDLFGSCRGSFGVDDMVHEVFTAGLEFEAATWTIM